MLPPLLLLQAVTMNHVATRVYPAFVDSLCFSMYAQMQAFAFRRPPLTKASFRWIKPLGRGGYGMVYAAQKLDTGKLYAVKCMGELACGLGVCRVQSACCVLAAGRADRISTLRLVGLRVRVVDMLSISSSHSDPLSMLPLRPLPLSTPLLLQTSA